MRHEIRADAAIVAEGNQSEPGALDRAERDDNLGVRCNGDETSVGQHAIDAFSVRLVNNAQPSNLRARHNHEALAHVVPGGLVKSTPRRFYKQRHCAEFVERKETGMLRPGLHGEWSFDLQLLAPFFLKC